MTDKEKQIEMAKIIARKLPLYSSLYTYQKTSEAIAYDLYVSDYRLESEVRAEIAKEFAEKAKVRLFNAKVKAMCMKENEVAYVIQLTESVIDEIAKLFGAEVEE